MLMVKRFLEKTFLRSSTSYLVL